VPLIFWASSVTAQSHEIVLDEPILRLGTDEGEYFFGFIIDWGLDDHGNYYILDYQENSITICDSSGSLKQKFGREGAGPGEFRRVNQLAVIDSSVYVLDTNLNRITVFNLYGEYLESCSVDDRIRKIIATSDAIYALVHHDRNIIWRADRSNLRDWRIYLTVDDVLYLQTVENQFLCQAFDIGYIGNELFITYPGLIRPSTDE